VTDYEVAPHRQRSLLAFAIHHSCYGRERLLLLLLPQVAGHSRLLDLFFCEFDRIVAACSGSLPFLPPDVHAIMPYHTTGLPTTATIALDQHTFHLVSTPPQAYYPTGPYARGNDVYP
jgi:hypothetical protein